MNRGIVHVSVAEYEINEAQHVQKKRGINIHKAAVIEMNQLSVRACISLITIKMCSMTNWQRYNSFLPTGGLLTLL